MVKRSFRLVATILGALILLGLGGMALLAWRLSAGPVSLGPLAPYVVDALMPEDAAFRLELGETSLRWRAGSANLAFQVEDLRLIDPDGAVFLRLPAASAGLGGPDLLKGEIRIRALTVSGLDLSLVRETDGRVHLADRPLPAGSTGGEAMSGFTVADALGLLVAGEDAPTGMLANVTTVRIENGRVAVDDRMEGLAWDLSEIRMELRRRTLTGRFEGSFLLGAGGVAPKKFQFSASLLPNNNLATVEAAFDFIRPADLSGAHPALAPLSAVDLPLKGSLRGVFDVDPASPPQDWLAALRRLEVTLDGDPGHLRLPDPVATDYPVEALSMSLTWSDYGRVVELRELTARVGSARVGATGSLDAGQPQLGGRIAGRLDATIEAMPVAELVPRWPAGIKRYTRDWIAKNLVGGTMERADFGFDLAGDSGIGSLDVIDLSGRLNVTGTEVGYIPGMPRVQGVSGTVDISPRRIDIDIKSGHVGALTVQSGTVAFTELGSSREPAEVNLTVSGPVPAHLALIDNDPLNYARAVGIDPEAAKGDATVDLTLGFPLIVDLDLDALDISARASMQRVALPDVIGGRALTEGDLALRLDNAGIELAGDAQIAGVPLQVTWDYPFGNNTGYVSRYRVTGKLDNAARTALGLPTVPMGAPYVEGPVHAEASITETEGGVMTIGAQFDLSDAAMALPGLGWRKIQGAPANGSASVRFENGVLTEVSGFQVTAGDNLALAGSVNLDAAGEVSEVRFDTFRVDRHEGAAVLRLLPAAISVDVTGRSFDLARLIDESSLLSEHPSGDAADRIRRVRLNATVDRLWTSEAGYLRDVGMTLNRGPDRLYEGALTGFAGDGTQAVRLTLDPAAPDTAFDLRTENGGALLQAFGLFENVRGGNLAVTGRLLPSGELTGEAEMSGFRLVDAPVLARVLTVAALTGIVDELSGQGIAFNRLSANVTMQDGVFRIADGRTSGPSLGLTANGYIDNPNNRIDMTGTIVPAYLFNSLLGNIPLLGDLLVGEAGGGIFGVTYTVRGPIDQPEIVVNPLSALAPGFLRNLFSGSPEEPLPPPVPDAVRPGTDADNPANGSAPDPASGPASPAPAPAPAVETAEPLPPPTN